MTRYLCGLILISAAFSFLLAGLSCTTPRTGGMSSRDLESTTRPIPNVEAPPPGRPTLDEWAGVYSSSSEVGGFTGTVIQLEKEFRGDGLRYRMHFYTDVVSADNIEQDVLRGVPLAYADSLFLPEAFGYYHDGKPVLQSRVTRYVMRRINGHTVLMRDDALKAYEDENKLYDYGILIKVSEDSSLMVDLPKVEHKSIKMLYAEPGNPWRDPFVHGPNAR